MNRGSCEHVYLGAPVKGFIISQSTGRQKPHPVDLCEACYELVKSGPVREAGDRRRTAR